MKNNNTISNIKKQLSKNSFYGSSFLIVLIILQFIKLIIIYFRPGYQDLPIFDNILITFLSDGLFIIISSIIVLINISVKRPLRIIGNILLFILLLIFCADLFYIFLLGSRVTLQEIFEFISLGYFERHLAILGFICLLILLFIISFHKFNVRKLVIWMLSLFVCGYILDGLILFFNNKELTNENSDNIMVYSLKSFLNNEIKLIPYDEIKLIAHRGVAKDGISENSLESFLKANKLGADGIEFDVVQTKDGENIVLHDEELSTSNCKDKKAGDYTYDWIYGNCTLTNGEKYLKLKDMLEKINGLFEYYFLKIKVYNEEIGSQQAENIIKIVKDLNMQDKIIFISYSDSARKILNQDDDIIFGWDTFNVRDLSFIGDNNSAYFLTEHSHYITQSVIKRAENLYKKIVTYTVNSERDLERMRNLGINIYMTDELEKLKQYTSKQTF